MCWTISFVLYYLPNSRTPLSSLLLLITCEWRVNNRGIDCSERIHLTGCGCSSTIPFEPVPLTLARKYIIMLHKSRQDPVQSSPQFTHDDIIISISNTCLYRHHHPTNHCQGLTCTSQTEGGEGGEMIPYKWGIQHNTMCCKGSTWRSTHERNTGYK